MSRRGFTRLGRSLSCSIPLRPGHSRRVVVTGIGIVSPLGVGTKNAWKALLDCSCGIVKLGGPDYEKLPCRIGKLISPQDPFFTFLLISILM